jgi:hypothetical protein
MNTSAATVRTVSDRKRPLVTGVNGPLMARRSGLLISPGLEFLPLPSAAWRRALEEHDDHQGDRNRRGGQDLACQTQIHGTGDGHHRHRVALGRGGRVVGHSSTRAARIYLHTREEREQQLAATLDRMARRELKASDAKRTARLSGTQRARDPQSGISGSEAGQHE